MNTETKVLPSTPQDVLGKIQILVKPEELNYGEFSRQPDFLKVNRDYLANAEPLLPNNFVFVDVATGTGEVVPNLLSIELSAKGKKGKIIGVDPNITSLNIARERFAGGNGVALEFIEGYGQNLQPLLAGKIPPEGVDGVSILNALHEIHDNKTKADIISSMAGILKPEGRLFFTSAFTTESNSREPSKYGRWKSSAMKLLVGNKKRDKEAKITQGMPVLTTQEYKSMIERASLKIISEAHHAADLSRSAWEALSKYPAFINGFLVDMPDQDHFSIQEKSSALIQTLRDLDIKSITKVWYEVIAQKPAVCPATNPTTIFQSNKS
jgi:ubiquinone/menaquinone biosynthesis C-methylase UbiE